MHKTVKLAEIFISLLQYFNKAVVTSLTWHSRGSDFYQDTYFFLSCITILYCKKWNNKTNWFRLYQPNFMYTFSDVVANDISLVLSFLVIQGVIVRAWNTLLSHFWLCPKTSNHLFFFSILCLPRDTRETSKVHSRFQTWGSWMPWEDKLR